MFLCLIPCPPNASISLEEGFISIQGARKTLPKSSSQRAEPGHPPLTEHDYAGQERSDQGNWDAHYDLLGDSQNSGHPGCNPKISGLGFQILCKQITASWVMVKKNWEQL